MKTPSNPNANGAPCLFLILACLTFSSCKPTEINPVPPTTRNPDILIGFIYQEIEKQVAPGVSTKDIEDRIQRVVSQTAAVPYFKGYRGYPSIISTPVNFEVVHTPPTTRALARGDLLKIEFGLKIENEHSFVGWTFPVGKISEKRAKLLVGAHRALQSGLTEIRDSANVGSISLAIENELLRRGLYPSREFQGYQIGSQPSMSPAIPCFAEGPVAKTPVIKSGMKLAVIVIAHATPPKLRLNPDNWTVHDGLRGDSAYFSALVRVTDSGYELLTQHPTWQEPNIDN